MTALTRREAWGYGVWFFFGLLVAVPELWASISPDSARWPTISATVGYLEYHHVWVAVLVTGFVVASGVSALRYGPDDRTPEGGRLTTAAAPVREIGAALYFASALAVIAGGTAIAAATTDVDDEHAVGLTLYGLTAFFWVVVPTVLAWPPRWAADVPFATLIETVRSLERRVRVLALVIAAGVAVLLMHLVFYPWPSSIPDLQDLHAHRARPPAPTAP